MSAGTPSVQQDATSASSPRTGPPAAAVGAAGVAALVALVLALLLTGGAPEPAPVGLPDAGAGTGWAVPVLRLLQHGAAVATVGALLAGLLAVEGGRRTPGGTTVVAVAASAWALLSVASVVVGLSEAAGRPLGTVLDLELVRAYTEQVAPGRALLQTAALAAAVALAAPVATHLAGRVTLLALALAALVPPLRTGHAATAADHDLAVVATSVHVLAVVLWVGGLWALVGQRGRPSLAVAVPRFSALALLCFVAVVTSGSVASWTRLPAVSDLWTSGYGALLLVKAVAVAALGSAGWLHRRRTLPAVARGEHGAFARLAGAELGLMAGALGLAVALTRTSA
jgi:putative copper resistance protein D